MNERIFMYFHHILDKPYCVYGHFIFGEILYIGSGKISRAFECTRAQRNVMWHRIREGRPVSVRIFETFATCNEARRFEYAMIAEKDPPANSVGRIPKKVLRPPPLPPLPNVRAKREKTKYPKPKALKPLIEVRDALTGDVLGQFPSIREAYFETEVSLGAISSSITKRHPVVRGKTFHRVDPRS